MMNYIPGQIHEKLQREHFFLINYDFSWINCRDKRFKDMTYAEDWNETDVIELSKGDVVVVRFFKESQTSEVSYLERVIYNNGDVTEYKTESTISFGLIHKNSILFADMTKSFERDKKIETILNEYERII